MSWSLEVCGW